MFNNPEVARKVHVLIICVLPSQLAGLVDEINDHITKQTLVYCMVNNASAKKLRRTLKSTNIIIPSYTFNAANAANWNSCTSIHGALEDSHIINRCCPLSQEGRG